MKKLAVILAAVLLLTVLPGCGGQVEGEASVQSVAMLCGLGSVGMVNRFNGVVSARSEVTISRDENKAIGEMMVSEGEEVTAGQVLFTYDLEQAELSLEKGRLELEQMRASVETKQAEKEKLEAQAAKAKESELLSYTLAIQEIDTAIRETNYNITLKEKEVQRLEDFLTELDVTSPVDGKILQLNEEEGYDNYGNRLPFIKIMETGSYRVKGYINENNISSLMEGTPVIIRSRLDDSVWTGYVAMVDWENPSQNQNGYSYPGDDTSSSSKYPFYVELDSAEGLLLGQHVYIEPDFGQNSGESAELALPEYYINDPDSNPWVWAQDSNGKLEKRPVKLGAYDEQLCTWVIASGLTAKDYVAYPDESYQVGMNCTTYDESAFSPDIAPVGGYGYDDNGIDYGMIDYGETDEGFYGNYEEAYDDAGTFEVTDDAADMEYAEDPTGETAVG